MTDQLVECVPNISEGRNPDTIQAIADEIRNVPGAWLLDLEMDPDHHRSVLTFAGVPDSVAEAAIRIAGRVAELIDLTRHAGAHPRIGALDVLPFVPLRGISMAECAGLAVEAAREIWRRFLIPAYLYEAAGQRADRKNLAAIRQGQFERLRSEATTNSDRAPDVGGPALHPTAGAVAVGARKLLIAYNVQLDSPDVELARRIARRVRASSGGLPHVKAMGVWLQTRALAQVSMNLTDFEVTPPHVAFEAVREEARRLGCGVRSSEIVGLIPRRALEMGAGHDLRWENLTENSVLENRLAAAAGLARDTL